jgi:sulfur relay (sulfurtransferase) complex TusBCD TusD component (DsrE family)
MSLIRQPIALALVVSTPDAAELDHALALAAAARSRGEEVAIFVMSDAVAGLPDRRAALAALADDHVELVCCATSASERGLDEAAAGMTFGSQDDHARIVDRADRLVAFT